jgi:hypothetical protein
MTRKLRSVDVYTVVEVWRGMASSAKTFLRLSGAQRYMRRARQSANLLEDDVQIFRSSIRSSDWERRRKTKREERAALKAFLPNRSHPLRTLRQKQRGWTLDVLNAVRSLRKPEFTLPEAYSLERSLAQLHPANRHVRDKIRQQLQVLRDLNLLEFIGRGKYRLR